MGLFSARTETLPQGQKRDALSPQERSLYDRGIRIGEQFLPSLQHTEKLLRQNPQQFQNISGREEASVTGFRRAAQRANSVSGRLARSTSGITPRARAGVNQAFEGLADNYNGVTTPYAGLTRSGAGMDRLYDRFEDPYVDDVVDTTLDGMRFDNSMERQQRASEAAAVGGIASSRAGVADALARRLESMNMAETEAKLRSDAFTSARELGLNEADYRLDYADSVSGARQARADALTGIGESEAARFMDLSQLELDALAREEELNDMQFARDKAFRQQQAGLGSAQREINDANVEAKRVARRDAASWFGTQLAQNRPSSFMYEPTPDQKVQRPSKAGSILGGAAKVASAFFGLSDERMKEDIGPLDDNEALEALRKTQPKSYRYREGAGHRADRTRGLMAQDIEKAGLRDVVVENEDGVKHVDLYGLTTALVGAVRALDERTRPQAGLS